MTSNQQPSPDRFDAQISIQKLLEQQQLLGKIAQKICQPLNLSEIFNTAVTEVRKFLQADRVVIYQFHLDMGMGTLTLEETTAKRWKFREDKLVEVRTGSDSSTCDYARGFLCGAVTQKMGGQVKVAAVEMTCQSMADECCQFVVQVVE